MTIDANLTDWLRSAATPTIHYLTLTRLQGVPADHPEVINARREIMTAGPVPEILAGQTPAGPWAPEHSYYTPKYTSSHWSLLLLTELEVDGEDPRFGRGVDYMLSVAAGEKSGPASLTTAGLDLACLWGNIVRYALHAGRLNDPRTQDLVDFLVRTVHNGGCRCIYNNGLGCGWGVARALWGLAAVPPSERSTAVEKALEAGLDFLLTRFSLVEAGYPVQPGGKVHPLWFKLNFPLFYQADILFVLRLLMALNGLDRPGAVPALDWLAGRRQRNGRWRGSSPFRGRTWPGLGDKEETDRWVSLQAALILQAAGAGAV